MVVHRRKKVTKYRGRGSGTHGGGARKKRRGSGSRGGRGNAGTGKRAGHKKVGLGNILGRRGFVNPVGALPLRTLNLGYLTLDYLERLVAEGKAHKEGGTITLNLTALGYDKLLGAGEVHAKLKVIVSRCSMHAEDKIKAAGGEVIKAETQR